MIADLIGIHAGDFLVTEAGFGADMGAERFFNIKCRTSGLRPDAAVIVATVRALKAHSGKYKIVAGKPLPEELLAENPDDVAAGAANLRKQIENIRLHGVSPVVAINAFPTDHPSEHQMIRDIAAEQGARSALCTHFADGGRGAIELAEAVAEAADEPSNFAVLYPDSASLREKIATVATKVYGADGVEYSAEAGQAARHLRAGGFREPAGLHRQDPPVHLLRPRAQGRPDRLDPAGPRGARLGRCRVRVPDLRRRADHARAQQEPGGRPHRPRRGWPGRGTVLTSSLDQPVGQFLDQIAARSPAPGGGGAAALTGALAAGLVAMAARFSAAQLPDAGDLAARADQLRHRAAELVDEDAQAYGRVLDAFALPRTPGRRAGPAGCGRRLERAAAVPLEMTEIAAQVAEMAARLAAAGNPNLRGDSVSAALLAEASARSAACLVDINVALGGLGNDVSLQAAEAVAAATAAAQQATAG